MLGRYQAGRLALVLPATRSQRQTPSAEPTVSRDMSGGAADAPAATPKVLSIADLKLAADDKLPELVREFYNSGSTEQRTIAANEAALARYQLRSRVLVPVKGLDTSTSVLGGVKVKFPLGVAPAGIQAAAHRDGELATARAISRFGLCQAISSFASFGVQDIVDAGRQASGTKAAGEAPAWAMQLYPMQDRALQERIVKRAETAGCRAIFLTGDSPVLGVRYNEWRNDFRTPAGIGFPILERTSEKIRSSTHDSGFATINDDSASWTRDIAWLRERTKMRIYVKGVMCGEDVRHAVQAGCDGVVVSNHGGRQLDGVPGTMDILEECVDAARQGLAERKQLTGQSEAGFEVHVDGGFRKGSDVFVALALGATCAWVGRPVLWGLAYDGEKGVQTMLEIFYEDFRRCMALCGCRTVEDINRSCLARMGMDGVLRPLTRASRL